MPNFNTIAPDEDTMNDIRRYLTGAGAGMLGAAGTVASMNPLGGLLALGGAAYPRSAEAPTEPIGPPLTNEQMQELANRSRRTGMGDVWATDQLNAVERANFNKRFLTIPPYVMPSHAEMLTNYFPMYMGLDYSDVDAKLVKKKKKKKKKKGGPY